MSEHPTNAPPGALKPDDGGPAFPTDNAHQNSPSTWHFEGMSLRAYFMAHAPTEPQRWFKPVLAGLVATLPSPVTNPTDLEKHEPDGWRDGDYSATDIQSERAREYAMAVEEFRKASAVYSQELERQRYLQWPAAWADEQLAILRGQP